MGTANSLRISLLSNFTFRNILIRSPYGQRILAAELRRFEETGKWAGENPERKRREGFNLTYEFTDAVKSAFGLLFFQHMSMLRYLPPCYPP
jgi:hypothetical protein